MKHLWLKVLTLSLPVAGPCLGTDWIGRPVSDILFEPPLPSELPELYDHEPALRVGQPLVPGAVRQSIQSLFRTGRFADIKVDAEAVGSGVRLKFLHKPSWFTGNVRTLHAPRRPTQSQLINATGLRLGMAFTDETLGRAVRSVRSLLMEEGFRFPVIRPTLERDAATRQVDITLDIRAGRQAAIGALLIVGRPHSLSAEEIRAVARWPRGAPYSRDRIQQGIGMLRQHFRHHGYHQPEIRVETAEYRPESNEYTLVASIVLGPQLLIRVEGAALAETALQRLLPIMARGSVDEELLVVGRERLEDRFQARGYLGVAVEYEIQTESAEEISIVYRVNRGSRQVLRAIEIRGNRFLNSASIRERLQIRATGPRSPRGEFTASLLNEDLLSIRDLYQSNGYRDATVEGMLVNPWEGDPHHAGVRINIVEGQPTFVDGLVTSGLESFPLSEESFEFASAPGRPFSESAIASDRRRILAQYFERGYREASFDWRVEEGNEPRTAVVYYDINPGEPVRTGRVFLSGARRTRNSILERRIDLRPGAPLAQSAMFSTQRNLYDLGVFSKVDVAVQNPNGAEHSKNVVIQVEEARRWAIGGGGGAEFARIGRNTAELTNPAGDATFSPRVTLEVTRLNVRGRAHTMGFRSRLSLLQQRGLFTYEAPRWFDSDRWRMTISALFDTFRNVNTFTGRRLEGAYQLSQQLNATTTVLYRYAYRRTAIDENTLNIQPLLVPLISQPVRVGLLSGTLISDNRDDPTNTTDGVYNTVDFALASKYVGAQPNFVRLLAQNSTYHRIRAGFVVARTVQVGVNVPWAGHGVEGVQTARFAGRPDPRIPISERYFGGGANSHRGFPYNQAGPRDPATGFPLGGGAQFLNSIELRFPLGGRDLSGVIFHDAGNVYSRPGGISFRSRQQVRTNDAGVQEFDFDYMVHALGLGVRYRTPIGPVRFDVAFTPNAPRYVGFDGTREQLLTGTGNFRALQIRGIQFHFSLGQTF